jgi:hypothetical protein
MSKRDAIGAHVKIAYDNLLSVKALIEALGYKDRNSCIILFGAAENLVMAALKSEDIPNSQWRGSAQHQIDRMVDFLPDECSLKEKLRCLDPLTAYATTYRYPTVSGKAPKPMSEQDTRKMAITLAGLVKTYCEHFGIELKQDNPKSLHAKPMREPSFEQTREPAAPAPC